MSMFATEAAAADKFVNRPDDPAGPASLPVDAIEPAANQPRRGISDESISELAESIADHGVLQPILVEPAASRERGAGIADHGAPQWRIIAGERRWRAAKQAGLEAVPAIVLEGLSDQQRAEIQLIENLQREDLSPIEEARALQLLIQDHGLTQDQLSTRISKSRVWVTQALGVLKLPGDLQRQCCTCNIPRRVLYEIATAEPESLQRGLFERAKRDALTYRQAVDAKKAADAKLGDQPPGPRRINAERIVFGEAPGEVLAVKWPAELRDVDCETKAAALERAAAVIRSGGGSA